MPGFHYHENRTVKRRKVRKENQLIKLEFFIFNSLFPIWDIQNLFLFCFVNEDSFCNALLDKAC